MLANPTMDYKSVIQKGLETERAAFFGSPDKVRNAQLALTEPVADTMQALYDKHMSTKTAEEFSRRQQNEQLLRNELATTRLLRTRRSKPPCSSRSRLPSSSSS